MWCASSARTMSYRSCCPTFNVTGDSSRATRASVKNYSNESMRRWKNMGTQHPMQELQNIMTEMGEATSNTAKMRALGFVLESKRAQTQGSGLPIRDAERRVIGARHEVDGVECITLEGGL